MSSNETLADLVARRADGTVVAVIEVKNSENLNPETAAQFRRNLLVHAPLVPAARFFLLVSQDVGYLWDQHAESASLMSEPTVTFPVAPLVEYYLPSFAGKERLSSSQLELAVFQWLWDIANVAPQRPRDSEIPLSQTPFLRALEGGRVDWEVAA